MGTQMGSIRRLFPGGNTSLGFFSFYDQIIKADANRIFILKGGPGVGKSTFMKQIAEFLCKQGFDLEYHHCSSDNNSLDGVMIPALEVAIIDGTAPHIVDPKNPGVVEEIVNLGEFWDESGLKKQKNSTISTNRLIGDCFDRAYTYLRAATEVYSDLTSIRNKNIRLQQLFALVGRLKEEIFSEKKPAEMIQAKNITHPKEGSQVKNMGKAKNSAHSRGFNPQVRKLFASAITPDGPINYLETIFKSKGPQGYKNLFILEGHPGCGKEIILEKILDYAVEKGHNAEVFYCPLQPRKPEHLWLPQLKTGVISAHWPHQYTGNDYTQVIDLSTIINPLDVLEKEALRQDEVVFMDLLEKAIGWIQKAKTFHDKLEELYIPHMNFDGIEELRIRVTKKILDT